MPAATTRSRARATWRSPRSATAHARMCTRGEWYLNEKDLLARAGLDAVQPVLRALGPDLLAAVARVEAVLGAP